MAQLSDYLAFGQSIWLDDIRRSYFATGEFDRLVTLGLRGLTSNPSIFEKAIAGSADYDQEIARMAQAGQSVEEIYENLAVTDIRLAADALFPVYEQSAGADGYVSLEVSPFLAHNTQVTASEAVRLFYLVDRPNLMIKIPATAEGMPAIRRALAQGVNVNVTLIFSVAQYEAVAETFLAGLEDRLQAGGDLSRIGSVASFFVSRLDSLLDPQLEAKGRQDLLGKTAIANCKLAYACFQELFATERWERLAAHGARRQRPLWASTSAKNPAYPDTLYVDTLVGSDTVNTLPYATLTAVLDHGAPQRSIDQGLAAASLQIASLAEVGVDLAAATQTLLEQGVKAFTSSFEALLTSISRKRERLRAASQPYSASLGGYQSQVAAAIEALGEQQIPQRIWKMDHTVWKPKADEIANRLGWLDTPEKMLKELSGITSFVEQARQTGFTNAVLLGMGGSSLAPEVLVKTFGVRPGYLYLTVLDSTDPETVLDYTRRFEPAHTLYIVSSKSGGTIETDSFFKYFYSLVLQKVGEERAGEHFVAITDPGTRLAEMARELGFRAIFLNDPNLGGRYSALSHFGLVPAALAGVDIRQLLQRALGMADHCRTAPAAENLAARLGAAIGVLALQGRDKLTLVTSTDFCTFGDWVEQLVAESTGKDGRGVLPVVGGVVGEPENYGDDRAFVYLRLAGNHDFNTQILALEYAGFPVIRLEIEDLFDLGGQFFLWEFATAVAGERLGIQPFDQPNVEAAKLQARAILASYQKTGKLPEVTPNLVIGDTEVFGNSRGEDLAQIWVNFLALAQPGGYAAIHAYLPPLPANDASLLALRTELRNRTRLAVTTGYGPRFLHSTGQLHKGDAGRGLFVQITHEPTADVPIPVRPGSLESDFSFGVLETAQALGDWQALSAKNRPVLRFHLKGDLQVGLARLVHALS